MHVRLLAMEGINKMEQYFSDTSFLLAGSSTHRRKSLLTTFLVLFKEKKYIGVFFDV